MSHHCDSKDEPMTNPADPAISPDEPLGAALPDADVYDAREVRKTIGPRA